MHQDNFRTSVISVKLSEDVSVFLVGFFFQRFWIKSAICKPLTVNLYTCQRLPNIVTDHLKHRQEL